MKDISDSQLLHDVKQMEQEYENFDCGVSDSQCVRAAICAEEDHFDQFDVSNTQLLHDVNFVQRQYAASRVSLGSYQGPAVPMPSLKNDSIVLPSVSRNSCKPNFDLGFHVDSDSDDDSATNNAGDFKVPQAPAPKKT